MKKVVVGTLLGMALSLSGHADAAPLAGTTVFGSINFGGDPTNYYDPANGFVPASGFENSPSASNSPYVPISLANVKFGFMDDSNTDTAEFNASSLTVSDASNGAVSFTQTFVDSAFSGYSLGAVSGSDYFSFSLTGDTLTVTSNGTRSPGNFVSSVNLVDNAPVGAPAPLAGAGLLSFFGAGGVAMRKRAKRALGVLLSRTMATA